MDRHEIMAKLAEIEWKISAISGYWIEKRRESDVGKRYSKTADDASTSVVRPAVNEAKAQPYGRRKERGQGIPAAASIATVKRRLKKPVKRTRRDIAWALDIVGIGEGPADLSQRVREYLHGDK
ncbi:MAG: hypothetical protein HY695_24055 [Deltaproteobacteria bacterium]|nr:hypothetical protein [Deltaproteobacteria bacterium]